MRYTNRRLLLLYLLTYLTAFSVSHVGRVISDVHVSVSLSAVFNTISSSEKR